MVIPPDPGLVEKGEGQKSEGGWGKKGEVASWLS